MHFQLSTEKSLKIEFYVQKFNCHFFNLGTSVPRQNDSCRKGPLFIHLSLVDFYIPPQSTSYLVSGVVWSLVYILPGLWSVPAVMIISVYTNRGTNLSSHAEIWKIFSLDSTEIPLDFIGGTFTLKLMNVWLNKKKVAKGVQEFLVLNQSKD